MIVPEVVVQFFSSILSSLQMREVESTFPAWLMSEAAIGWTQTSLGITALSLIPARGPKTLAWRSLTWAKAMTEFIVVVSISRLHKPELQGSTWLLWVSTIFLVAFEKDSFGMCLGASDLFFKTENRLWHKNAPYSVPDLMHLHFHKKTYKIGEGKARDFILNWGHFQDPDTKALPLGLCSIELILVGTYSDNEDWRGIYHGGKYLFSQLFHMCPHSSRGKSLSSSPPSVLPRGFSPRGKGS